MVRVIGSEKIEFHKRNRLKRMIMKRLRTVLVVLLAAGVAGWSWYQGRMDYAEAAYYGYVEGDYIHYAAPVSGTLADLNVMRGQPVDVGDALFALDDTTLKAEKEQAVAAAARAKADLADLKKGARPDELAVREAELAEAQAALVNAELDLKRQQELKGTSALVEAKLDQTQAARDQAAARVQALRAGLAVLKLPARADRIDAAKDLVAEAEARVAAVDRKLSEIAPLSKAKGMVQDTYYLPGAWVVAGQPIVSVLPDDKRKLRFYVPQGEIAGLKIGQQVSFGCSGCADGLKATISYIAPEAEYTPPVIYSAESREKLVFLLEAALEPGVSLPVGLPVEVQKP